MMMATMSKKAVLALFLLPAASAFAPVAHPVPSVRLSTTSYAPRLLLTSSQVQYASSSSSKLQMSDAVAEAPAAVANDDDDGGATIPELIFNLVKGIVGAGVLSLPAGIAAWANAPSAVFPAVALITIIGALSGYGFALIGRVCAYTDTKSYRDAWSASVSEKTSWLPAVAVTFKTICAILAYSMILGDTFKSLFAMAGIMASKTVILWGITGAVLLPLCLLKNLSSLAPFSLVGSLGMMYTAVAMTIRYLGKSYVGSGKFATDCAPALQPAFGSIGASGALTPSAAILVGMLSTAYMAHFNAPKVRNYEMYRCCCCMCARES
jgi:amino acid permease